MLIAMGLLNRITAVVKIIAINLVSSGCMVLRMFQDLFMSC